MIFNSVRIEYQLPPDMNGKGNEGDNKVKITTQAWPGNGRMHPPLWDVLVDGKNISGGAGRVLKSPWGYMPIVDNVDNWRLLGTCKTRREAAQIVVDVADGAGLLTIKQSLS